MIGVGGMEGGWLKWRGGSFFSHILLHHVQSSYQANYFPHLSSHSSILQKSTWCKRWCKHGGGGGVCFGAAAAIGFISRYQILFWSTRFKKSYLDSVLFSCAQFKIIERNSYKMMTWAKIGKRESIECCL